MNDDTPQEEKISKKLDIDFIPQHPIVKKSPDVLMAEESKPIEDIDLKKDYITARKNLREILMSGSEAIDGILTVAKESDSPRAYEVAAQLIKAVADVNKDLLEIHKKIKEVESGGSESKPTSITNNSIFVGSTKELQSLLKRKYKELSSESEIQDDRQAE